MEEPPGNNYQYKLSSRPIETLTRVEHTLIPQVVDSSISEGTPNIKKRAGCRRRSLLLLRDRISLAVKSPNRDERLRALKLASVIPENYWTEQMCFNSAVDGNSSYSGNSELVKLCQSLLETAVSLESRPDNFANERQKARDISALAASMAGVCLLENNAPPWIARIACRILLSQYQQKFKPLWRATTESFAQFCTTFRSDESPNDSSKSSGKNESILTWLLGEVLLSFPLVLEESSDGESPSIITQGQATSDTIQVTKKRKILQESYPSPQSAEPVHDSPATSPSTDASFEPAASLAASSLDQGNEASTGTDPMTRLRSITELVAIIVQTSPLLILRFFKSRIESSEESFESLLQARLSFILKFCNKIARRLLPDSQRLAGNSYEWGNHHKDVVTCVTYLLKMLASFPKIAKKDLSFVPVRGSWDSMLDLVQHDLMRIPSPALQEAGLSFLSKTVLANSLISYYDDLRDIINAKNNLAEKLGALRLVPEKMAEIEARDALGFGGDASKCSGRVTIVQTAHRAVVIPLLARILLSKLSGPGAKSKNRGSQRRTIYRFWNSLESADLPYLLAPVFYPVMSVVAADMQVANAANRSGPKELSLQQIFKVVFSHGLRTIQSFEAQLVVETAGATYHATWTVPCQNTHCPVTPCGDPAYAKISLHLQRNSTPYELGRLTAVIKAVHSLSSDLRLRLVPFVSFLASFLIAVIVGTYQLRHGPFQETQQLKQSNNEKVTQQSADSSTHDLRGCGKSALVTLQRVMTDNAEHDALWRQYIEVTEFRSFLLLETQRALSSMAMTPVLGFICSLAREPHLSRFFAGPLSPCLSFITTYLSTVANELSAVCDDFLNSILQLLSDLLAGGEREEPNEPEVLTLSVKARKRMRDKRRRGNDSDDSSEEEELTRERDVILESIKSKKDYLEVSRTMIAEAVASHLAEIVFALEKIIPVRSGRQRGKAPLLEYKLLHQIAPLVRQDPHVLSRLIILLNHPLNQGFRHTSAGHTSAELQLIISCVEALLGGLTTESNVNSRLSNETMFEDCLNTVRATVGRLLLRVQDLYSRASLARLSLLICLCQMRGANSALDPAPAMLQTIHEFFPRSQAAASSDFQALSVLLPKNLKVLLRLPPHGITENSLWAVTSAAIVYGLTHVNRRTLDTEQDHDLTYLLLAALAQGGSETIAIGLIPPQFLQDILAQLLFYLRVKETDNTVRTLSVGIIIKLVQRVAITASEICTESEILGCSSGSNTSEIAVAADVVELLVGVVFRGVRRALKFADEFQSMKLFLDLINSAGRLLYPVASSLPVKTRPSQSIQEARVIAIKLFMISLQRITVTGSKSFFELLLSPQKVQRTQALRALQAHIKCHASECHAMTDATFMRAKSNGNRSGNDDVISAALVPVLDPWVLSQVVIPICFQCIIQGDKNEQEYQPLSSAACQCLGEVASVLSWPDVRTLIKQTASLIRKNPEKEVFLTHALSAIVSAVDSHAERAKKRDENRHIKNCDVQEIVGTMKSTDGHAAACSDVEDDTSDEEEGTLEVESASFSRAFNPTLEEICHDISRLLLPLLRSLMVQKRSLEDKRKKFVAGVVVGKESKHSSAKQNSETATLIRPQIVAAVMQLARNLPDKEFKLELPSALEKISTCLASRFIESRRKARVALLYIVSALGPSEFATIVDNLKRKLDRGFRVPVLIYTCCAALGSLVLHDQTCLKKSATLAIPVGSIDKAVPLLLPLIDAELDRLCDPERPEYEVRTTGKGEQSNILMRKTTVPEATKTRANHLIFVLARCASLPVIQTGILKYLYGLLTGVSSPLRSHSTDASIAFGSKFRRTVAGLFDSAMSGISLNPDASVLAKIQLSRTLLLLQEKLLESVRRPGASTQSHPPSINLDLTEKDKMLIQEICSDSAYSTDPADTAMDKLTLEEQVKQFNEERRKRFIIQPGAATGRAAETASRPAGSADPTMRAAVLRRAALRLFALTSNSLRAHPLLSTPDELPELSAKLAEEELRLSRAGLLPPGYSAEVLHNAVEQIAPHIVSAFCGIDDEAFLLCAKCLLVLLRFELEAVEQRGRNIALRVLKLFQETAAASSSHLADAGQVRNLMAVCTRLLADLLSKRVAVSWFNDLLNDKTISPASAPENTSSSVGKKEKNKKVRGGNVGQTLTLALLMQIRASLEDHHVQCSAVHLLRRVLFIQEKEALMSSAEQAAHVYRCADDIFRVMLQQSSDSKLMTECVGAYTEFLVRFPNTVAGRDRYMAAIIKHLSYSEPEGRRVMLALVNEILTRFPPQLVVERYGGLLLLGLLLRLGTEPNVNVRKVVQIVLNRLWLLLMKQNDAAQELLELAENALLPVDDAAVSHRAAFADFISIVAENYIVDGKIVQRLPQLLGYLSKALRPNSDTAIPGPGDKTTNSDLSELTLEQDEWKVAYAVLRSFATILKALQCNVLCASVVSITSIIALLFRSFLSFAAVRASDRSEHLWVRNAGATVLQNFYQKALGAQLSEEFDLATTLFRLLNRGNAPRRISLVHISQFTLKSNEEIAPPQSASPMVVVLMELAWLLKSEEIETQSQIACRLSQTVITLALISIITPVFEQDTAHFEAPGDYDDFSSAFEDNERFSLAPGDKQNFSFASSDHERRNNEETMSDLEEFMSMMSHRAAVASSQKHSAVEQYLESDDEADNVKADSAEAPENEEKDEAAALSWVTDDRSSLIPRDVFEDELQAVDENELDCSRSEMHFNVAHPDTDTDCADTILVRLKKCRIRWIIGLFSSFARTSLGSPGGKGVRLSCMYRTLGQIALTLPKSVWIATFKDSKDSSLRNILNLMHITISGAPDPSNTRPPIQAPAFSSWLDTSGNFEAAMSTAGPLAIRIALGHFATAILQDVERHAAASDFSEAYSSIMRSVRKDVLARKTERRLHRLQLRTKNPQAAAQLKLKASQRRTKHKRRQRMIQKQKKY